jgi:hypothetical protein
MAKAPTAPAPTRFRAAVEVMRLVRGAIPSSGDQRRRAGGLCWHGAGHWSFLPADRLRACRDRRLSRGFIDHVQARGDGLSPAPDFVPVAVVAAVSADGADDGSLAETELALVELASEQAMFPGTGGGDDLLDVYRV